MKPTTKYTKSGRINIAYQVFGSGNKDLVYIPGWISNIDLIWDCPPLVLFFTQLSKVARIILFDKRGTGLSDRVSDLSSLEERMDDIRAVMDAVESDKAILFGHSEGGSVSALFSATYPQRTAGLITFGVFAKRKWSEDYPWAPTDDERQKVYDMIDEHWGSGEMDLESLAPSMKDNKQFMDWLARYFRSGASPNAALALTKMNTQIDIRDILPTISVPTLLIYRTHDIDVKIEEGRYIAKEIPGAKFIELSGNDHLFWAGDSKKVIQHMIHFIENDCTQKKYDKVLSTILKLKIFPREAHAEKSPLENDISFEDRIEETVHQYLGNILEVKGAYFTATFAGPSKAVHCAIDIQNMARLFNLEVSQGLHIGEISLLNQENETGITIEITKKILDNAKPNQILVTNTINSLLSGGDLAFTPYGNLTFNIVKEINILLLDEIHEDELADADAVPEMHFLEHVPKNHSLLENVMQSIENHITDESYNIQKLSQDVGISTRQLQRKIKAITNKSPNTLIRSVRLHKAKELIIQDKRSVKEAAFQTGFNSLSYFSTSFKKEFGISPSNL